MPMDQAFVDRWIAAINADPACANAGRQFDGSFTFAIGQDRHTLHVRRGRIVAAQCMLPLTESTSVSRELGTRHRAALGVTEEGDAVAVVVSEESGRISIAQQGRLEAVADPAQLEELLSEALEGGENGR